jgi:hypothetical protein
VSVTRRSATPRILAVRRSVKEIRFRAMPFFRSVTREFSPTCEKFLDRWDDDLPASPETRVYPANTSASGLALLLPPRGYEHSVFRAALLSIVLLLAAGQDVSLLCRTTWCDPQSAEASGCHRNISIVTPSVADDDSCDNSAVSATAVLRESVRRDVSSPDAPQAIPVPRYQISHVTLNTRLGREPWREPSLDGPPRPVVLRI